MAVLPPGIRLLVSFSRDQWFRALVLVLTFLLYCSFHLSRKPISIVKGELHRHCSEPHEVELHSYKEFVILKQPLQSVQNASRCGWAPFDKKNYKQLLGTLDYSFLCAYAVGMYLSGMIGERLPLRYFLSCGMIASGVFTALFGFGYFYNIHNLSYYIIIQILNGLVQTTGWPCVVTCIGNWFGKGRRGLIMGVWNSHTSVGNILGSLIAGYWVSSCWGMSFLVPGLIMCIMGILCFLFLIEHPRDVKAAPPSPEVSCKTQCNGVKAQNQVLRISESSPQKSWEVQSLLESAPVFPTHHVVVLQRVPNTGVSGSSAISFFGALQIPGVVEFSLCLLFAKLVSYTFLFWLPLYITSVGHMDVRRAGDLSTLFDVGGIFGGILAGVISDKFHKRATTCGLMLLCAAPTLYVFSAVSKAGPAVTVCMLLVCGALVNGPYSLITTAVSADLGTHKSLKGNSHALSTVTAIIDGTGSVGAALGPLLAGLLSPYGWDNVFVMLMISDGCALLFLIRLIKKELSCRQQRTEEQTEWKEH
ncbi:glucose-6-phosphate exchanger SLC37A1 [Bombina bombina]|uniref:glucose-6-phosphate exchanger SLC37A1 n=1 Tax=Bombina bombina TaxID=8345 RepID=UPI00235AFAAF|nr:glucose-6-phosphate exchanger SLC37A1 [Bombina bombina]